MGAKRAHVGDRRGDDLLAGLRVDDRDGGVDGGRAGRASDGVLETPIISATAPSNRLTIVPLVLVSVPDAKRLGDERELAVVEAASAGLLVGGSVTTPFGEVRVTSSPRVPSGNRPASTGGGRDGAPSDSIDSCRSRRTATLRPVERNGDRPPTVYAPVVPRYLCVTDDPGLGSGTVFGGPGGPAEQPTDRLGTAPRCVAVTERVRPGRQGRSAVEHVLGGGGDARRVRTDQLRPTGLHRLHALGELAQDEHRHAKRRGLLLDPSGVAEHDGRGGQQAAERRVGQRVRDQDARVVAERPVDLGPHRGVGVRGRTQRRSGCSSTTCRTASRMRSSGCPPVLPPVRGDEHQAGRPAVTSSSTSASRGSVSGSRRAATACAASTTVLPASTIALARNPVGDERRHGARGRGQMQIREHADEAAIRLFGKGSRQGLPDRSPASRCTSGTRRQNATSPPTSTDVVSPWTTTAAGRWASTIWSSAGARSATSSACSPLRRSSSSSRSGRQPEGGQGVGDHRRVLPGRDDYRSSHARAAQRLDERSHLDGLGSGPDHDEHGRWREGIGRFMDHGDDIAGVPMIVM